MYNYDVIFILYIHILHTMNGYLKSIVVTFSKYLKLTFNIIQHFIEFIVFCLLIKVTQILEKRFLSFVY